MFEDVYSDPEKFGLKVLAEIELEEPCYSFNIRVVWLHEATGIKYTAQDSGCSCPSPFEDYTSLESLDRLDINAIELEFKEYNISLEEKSRFLAAIK